MKKLFICITLFTLTGCGKYVGSAEKEKGLWRCERRLAVYYNVKLFKTVEEATKECSK